MGQLAFAILVWGLIVLGVRALIRWLRSVYDPADIADQEDAEDCDVLLLGLLHDD